jgi:hypothetical protein
LREIQESSHLAPLFVAHKERLRYEQREANKELAERKSFVQERHSALQRICELRINEQPEFATLVKRYGASLAKTSRKKGGYELFLAGFEIETFLEIKKKSVPDPDRSPPLSPDQLFAAQSLMIAHAGLVALFPDIQTIVTELDRYRRMSESLDALRNRVLDPAFQRLSQAVEVFDEEAIDIAIKIEKTSNNATASITQGVTSVKHSWIRGALAAIGQYVLKQFREIGKVARDTVVKEGVTQAIQHPDKLAVAMTAFLAGAKPILMSLAEALRAQFGWIASLFSHLGL